MAPWLNFTSQTLRLAIALSLSLLLHLLVLLFVRVGAIAHGGMPARPIFEARLISAHLNSGTTVLVKAIEKLPPSRIPDFKPTPKVVPDAPQKPDAQPAQSGMPQAAASAAQIDAPVLADDYYSLKEVDEHPRQMGNPVYPERAAQLNMNGSVKVRLLLNENGGVDEATILEATPAGFGFKESVLEYLKTAHFQPAILKGRAVKCVVEYHLDFLVENSAGIAPKK